VEAQNDVRIDLILIEEDARWMDSAPDGITIGGVCLRKWQTDPIDAPTGMFDGYNPFLVKINYEVLLDVGSSPLPWFEVAFDFAPDDGDKDVTVIDALPRFGAPSAVPVSYALNEFLNFVPCGADAGAHASVLASADRIDTFGIGGQEVRWRHVPLDGSGVRSGSYTAWVVLLVPSGQEKPPVNFTARYGVEPETDHSYRAALSRDFRLSLTPPSRVPEVVTPSPSAELAVPAHDFCPSAFICYAHETPEHKAMALRFANLLAINGVNVYMDQFDEAHRKDWGTWSHGHIKNDDFVIVLASPTCRAAFDGELKGSANLGLRSEARLISNYVHEEPETWIPKVLPVVLPHEVVENVPKLLSPWTTDHYTVEEFTVEGIDGILRAMTGVPRITRPPLGKLPPSVLRPLNNSES
jgi:hypothetical protein